MQSLDAIIMKILYMCIYIHTYLSTFNILLVLDISLHHENKIIHIARRVGGGVLESVPALIQPIASYCTNHCGHTWTSNKIQDQRWPHALERQILMRHINQHYTWKESSKNVTCTHHSCMIPSQQAPLIHPSKTNNNVLLDTGSSHKMALQKDWYSWVQCKGPLTLMLCFLVWWMNEENRSQ